MQRFLTIILAFTAANLFAQSNIQQSLGINEDVTAAHASAQLDVSAAAKGMLVPRMTTAQRTAIASPATGLLVFDTTTATFWFFNGATWVQIVPKTSLADMDGNTKVQVEKNPDEDMIRFDLGGTENMVLRKNAAGLARLEFPAATNNTFLGQNAGANNTLSFHNTGVGSQSLFSNTSGTQNTAAGLQSLYSNTTASENTAIGSQALFSNTTGAQNTAMGGQAMYDNNTGSQNTATGMQALYRNTSGIGNVATGHKALFDNTTGAYNCALGVDALLSNTTGSSNVAIGKGALASNTTRSYLVAVGDSALYWNGSGATISTQAIENTAVGFKAAFSNTTGSYNTAIGFHAMLANTTGTQNTAFGCKALVAGTTGSSNTAVGRNSLSNTTTGSSNTGVGASSLVSNTTGNFNTALGNLAYFTLPNLSNTTCLGYSSGGISNVSNRIEIGNSSVSWIGGQVNWGTYSDARIKTQVQENVPGLAFINKLRPVTYHLDIHKQNDLCFREKKEIEAWDSMYDIEQTQMTGFIAQEVEAAAKAVGYNFSGVEQAADDVGMYSVRYSEFVVPLVKAVQERQAIIETGNTRIETLEGLSRSLEAENAALQAQLEKITAALAGAGIAVEK